MRIYVCVKQVPDTETKIKLNADQSGIDNSGIKWIINPYDEFAIEEALKLKEASGQGQVTVVSIGPKARVIDALRTALAMGADDAVAVDADGPLDSLVTAKALAAVIKSEGNPQMVFLGRQSIDAGLSATGPMLAEFLDLPHASLASKFSYMGERCTVEREVEGGSREVIELTGPSVITTNKGLNTPRYASLPGIMKAKKKPLKELNLSELGLSSEDIKVQLSNYKMPPEKPLVKMLAGDSHQQAQELVKLLGEEAKVL